MEATTQLKSVMLVDEAYCRSISGSNPDQVFGSDDAKSDPIAMVRLGPPLSFPLLSFGKPAKFPAASFSLRRESRFLCVAFASLRSMISFTAPCRPTKSSRIPVGILFSTRCSSRIFLCFSDVQALSVVYGLRPPFVWIASSKFRCNLCTAR